VLARTIPRQDRDTDVAGRISKKQLILDYRDRHAVAQAGERQLRLIQKNVGDVLGGATPPSLSYIASVLRQAGVQVDYEDRYTEPAVPVAYAARLDGLLRFHDLATAEDALRTLDTAYRYYQSVPDHAGARLVQKLVLWGKQRAQSLATSGRISSEKRQEKREIASWFRIWLESPSLFLNWLEVRKQTEEFLLLFPSHSGNPPAQVPIGTPEG
jgi:hypothetical protein